MDAIWFIIKIAVLVSAAQFLLGPVVVYITMRQAANPRFQRFNLLDPPMHLPQSYTQNIALLEELGFAVVAHLYAAGQATASRSVITLFINRSERDLANVVHMLSETPLTRATLNNLYFSTVFAERSAVITTNSNPAAGLGTVSREKTIALPHL